jgi:excisionase family DNA binding protein
MFDVTYDGRRWVTMKQAADFLGVHVQTAYKCFYRGELPGARVGRRT